VDATMPSAILDEARESDRAYLSETFVNTLAVAAVLGGWLWGIVIIAQNPVIFRSERWLAPAVLVMSGLATSRLLDRHGEVATGILLVGAITAMCVATLVHNDAAFLFGILFIIVISGVVTTLPGVLLVAGASLASVLIIGPRLAPAIPRPASVAVCAVCALVLAIMLWRYVYVALELAFDSRHRAIQEMQSARQRQSELARALKAVDDGYDRLRRLNDELAAARSEAEESRRLKAEFAANVSHELRTPINLIIGFSEMMYTAPESYGGQTLPAEYMEDVNAIYRSARHLQTLVDDILDLARVDAQRMALNREMVDLGSIVREALDVIRDLVERKGLTLSDDIADDLPIAYLDRTRIRQVLLNLISNAVRFTDDGFVSVTCGTCQGSDIQPLSQGTAADDDTVQVGAPMTPPNATYLCVSVSDSGIGIRRDDIGKVFEEFRQVDGSSRRQHGGTGLGLAISKRFVQLHGGWMWVESSFGQGSCFRFLLPTAEATLPRSTLRSTRALGDGNRPANVIVALDPDMTLAPLARRRSQQHHLYLSTDVEEAVDLVALHAPSLLLLGQPDKLSAALERQSQRDDLNSARLTVMSCDLPGDRREAFELGLTDYLVKPVSEEQLRVALSPLGQIQATLIIEDDPDMMRLVGSMLRRIYPEASIDRAYSGLEAEEAIAGATHDVILLDLALPDMSGHKVLSWLREHDIDTPVIAVTADASAEGLPTANEVTLTRQSGFSLRELVSLAEMVASEYPSLYTLPGEPGNGRGKA